MKRVKIAVHNGAFHADDVFAVAALGMIHPLYDVVRTRDPGILVTADFRVDVGNRFDPQTGDFDHHQLDGPKPRSNGIPYASIGLVWKIFGESIAGSLEIAEAVDRHLIQILDANDSGISLPFDRTEPPPYTLPRMIDNFNPPWNESQQDYDSAFLKAVEFATIILNNEIRKLKSKVEAKEIVQGVINQSKGSPILHLDRYCPWQEVVIEKSDALYIIFPAPSGDWRVRAIPVQKGSFQTRKPFPASWAGKNEGELSRETGVVDSKFCHKDRFICGAYSREGAEKMAQIAASHNGDHVENGS